MPTMDKLKSTVSLDISEGTKMQTTENNKNNVLHDPSASGKQCLEKQFLMNKTVLRGTNSTLMTHTQTMIKNSFAYGNPKFIFVYRGRRNRF